MQQRRKTCWPLSIVRSPRAKDDAAPPSLGLASSRVTSTPAVAQPDRCGDPGQAAADDDARGARSCRASRLPTGSAALAGRCAGAWPSRPARWRRPSPSRLPAATSCARALPAERRDVLEQPEVDARHRAGRGRAAPVEQRHQPQSGRRTSPWRGRASNLIRSAEIAGQHAAGRPGPPGAIVQPNRSMSSAGR